MPILNTLEHFIKKLLTIKTASEVLHIAFQSQYLTAASGAAFNSQTAHQQIPIRSYWPCTFNDILVIQNTLNQEM